MIIIPSRASLSNYNRSKIKNESIFQDIRAILFALIIRQKGRPAHVFRRLPVRQRASGCGWPHAVLHATLADLFLFDKPWPSWTEPTFSKSSCWKCWGKKMNSPREPINWQVRKPQGFHNNINSFSEIILKLFKQFFFHPSLKRVFNFLRAPQRLWSVNFDKYNTLNHNSWLKPVSPEMYENFNNILTYWWSLISVRNMLKTIRVRP